jgi:lysophospholipase L1-like esterase
LEHSSTILFTGDSITDCERGATENPLGYGYPLRVAGAWDSARPDSRIRWLNTGLAGHRVPDLVSRWQTDVLDLEPDIVSILVGINDCSFRMASGIDDRPGQDEYRDGYVSLLEPLAARNVRLVLIEPFLLPVNEDQRTWRQDLDEKIQIVRDLARGFDARLLAADGIFAQRAATTGPEFWARDGVHPTAAGHQLIANAWLDLVVDGRW